MKEEGTQNHITAKLKCFGVTRERLSLSPSGGPYLKNISLSSTFKKSTSNLILNARGKKKEDTLSFNDSCEKLISHLSRKGYSTNRTGKNVSKIQTKRFSGNQISERKFDILSKNIATSEEKGTMTEPFLSKKSKQAQNEYSNIQSILQTISKNIADEKVPIVILSKSPSNKLPKEYVNMENRDYCINKSDESESDGAESDVEDESLSKQIAVIEENLRNLTTKRNVLSPQGKSDLGIYANDNPLQGFFSDSHTSDDENEYLAVSPDFKGFSSTKVSEDFVLSPSESIVIEDTAKRKLNIQQPDKQSLLDKETEPSDTGIAVLDHPYSHGAVIPSSNSQTDMKSPTKEYPQFPYVSRSVFGSPSSSKSPPDIMLHNDKINILRQMSKVFNDEKSNKESVLKCDAAEKPSLVAESAVDKKLTSSRALGILESQNVSATNFSISKGTAGTVSGISNIIVHNDCNQKCSDTVNKRVNSVVGKETDIAHINTSEKSSAIAEVLEKNILSPQNIDKEPDETTNNIITKPLRELAEEKNSHVLKNDSELVPENGGVERDIGSNELPTSVHLVSSHSLDVEESIRVKSYVGGQGEHVDIIDGFAFLSFPSEQQMTSFKNSGVSNRSRRRKRGRGSARQWGTKPVVKEYKSSGLVSVVRPLKESVKNSKIPKDKVKSTGIQKDRVLNDVRENDSVQSDDVNSEGKKDKAEKNIKLNEKTRHKSHDKKETNEDAKPSANNMFDVIKKEDYARKHSSTPKDSETLGAFASNDLDQFLNENSKLNISFPIPSCRATELGVTKFEDEEKNRPIVNSKHVAVGLPVTPSAAHMEERENHKHLQSDESLQLSSNILDKNKREKVLPKEKYSDTAMPVSNLETNEKSNLYVKRAGKLLPLSTVLKKSKEKNLKDPVEIIYVYHGGRLLTLGGSLTKVNPSETNNIKARVALPRDQRSLLEHSQRVSAKKVRVVEINEDMAKFALSALQTPDRSKIEDTSVRKEEPVKVDSKKLSKDNILDILTAKLSIDKPSNNGDKIPEVLRNPSSDKNKVKNGIIPVTNTIDAKAGKNALLNHTSNHSEVNSSSKIKWNQDDILKRSIVVHSSEQSKALRKNINRFPSLSREMKRLNMNYVQCDKESDQEDSGNEPVEDPCNKKFCLLGCVCESLKCKKRSQEHCGKPECMLQCACRSESWNKTLPTNVSIFSIDREHQKSLALREKDFRKTIIQSGSEVFLVDGEKKKRERKLPERYKDSTIWSDVSDESNPCSEDKDLTEPSIYSQHMKPFCLNVPWYDIEGVSAWCMEHSCYDCSCFTDPDFFRRSSVHDSQTQEITCTGVNTDNIEAIDEIISESSLLASVQPESLNKSQIVHFYINYDESVNKDSEIPLGQWILKHWIHNSGLHCARTCEYNVNNIVRYKVTKPLQQGYSLPAPKFPLIMGLTLKSSKSCTTVNKSKLGKSSANQGPLYKKARFYDGLGNDIPSLHTSVTVFRKTESAKNAASVTDSLVEAKSNTSEADNHSLKLEDQARETVKSSEENFCPKVGIKLLSLNDMIKEEETRGELEVDLTDTTFGRAVLIAESRFRKLINMKIIGVIGLNKIGRCIISSVTSSEDLIKMEKIQQMISNRTIDVGPNMREIFTPSTLVEGQKVRYVMLRCDRVGKWEIVGVVQRKPSSELMNAKPKKQRQLSKVLVTSLVNQTSTGTANAPETNREITPNISLELLNVANYSVPEDHHDSDNHDGNSVSDCRFHSSLEKQDKDAASVTSLEKKSIIDSCDSNKIFNRTSSLDTLGSRPSHITVNQKKPLNTKISSPKYTNTPVPLRTYFLNQASEKVFGSSSSAVASIKDATHSVSSVVLSPKTMATSYGLGSVSGVNEITPKAVSPSPVAQPKQTSSVCQSPLKVKLQGARVISSGPNVIYIPGASPMKPQLFSILRNNSTDQVPYKINMKLVPSAASPRMSVLLPTAVASSVTDPVIVQNTTESNVSSVSGASSKSNVPNAPLQKSVALRLGFAPVEPKIPSSDSISLLNQVISVPSQCTESPVKWMTVAPSQCTESPTKLLTALPSQCSESPVKWITVAPSQCTDSPTKLLTVAPSQCTESPTKWVSTTLSQCTKTQTKLVTAAVNSPILKAPGSDIIQQVSTSNSSACISEKSKISSLAMEEASTLEKKSVSSFAMSEKEPLSSLSSSTDRDRDIEAYSSPESNKSSPLKAFSPDVKCIAIKRHENCTAVDLSINFRSIKLHWLSGAIKKDILCDIYNSSKKTNGPISLFGRHNKERETFFGMHKCCTTDRFLFPVLILGSKVSSVIVTARCQAKELFRSNTIKYLIEDNPGNLSSYTYDVKGSHLIKVASKNHSSDKMCPSLGERVPVETMRKKQNKRMSTKTQNVTEEIVIDSDSEEDVCKGQENCSYKCSPDLSVPHFSPSVLANCNKAMTHEILPVNKRSLSLDDSSFSQVKKLKTSNTLPVLTTPEDINQNSESITLNSGGLGAISHQESQNSVGDMESSSVSVIKNSLSSATQNSAVANADISDQCHSGHIDGIVSVKVHKSKNSRDCLKKTASVSSCSLDGVSLCLENSQASRTRDTHNSISAPHKNMKTLVEKKHVYEAGEIGIACDGSRTFSSCIADEIKQSSEIVNSGRLSDPFVSQTYDVHSGAPELNQCSDGTEKHCLDLPIHNTEQTKPKTLSSDCAVSLKQLGNASDSSARDVDITVDGGVDTDSGSSTTTVLQLAVPSGDSEPFSQLLRSSKKSTQAKRELSSSKGALLMSSKRNLKSAKRDISCHSSVDRREKLPLNSSNNSASLGQEFHQIFSEAPQFWEMDSVERHNALERIRRKGLAKMFHNLHNSVKVVSKAERLPPKHVVLRNAVVLIQRLKVMDMKLNQEEILLRGKRMKLLREFSELLRNTDEEIQKKMEQWISDNISNPTAKEDFERLWKPSTIMFEDEPIKSATVGDITLKGSDITTYFEAHTSGMNSLATSPKGSPKKKLSRRLPINPNKPSFGAKASRFLTVKKTVLPSRKLSVSDERISSLSSASTEAPDEDSVRSVVPPPISDVDDFEDTLSASENEAVTSVASLLRSISANAPEKTPVSFHPL